MAEPSISNEIILGVDTHLDTHVGVIIDDREKWNIALVRMRSEPRAHAYVARKIAEGEIQRSLSGSFTHLFRLTACP